MDILLLATISLISSLLAFSLSYFFQKRILRKTILKSSIKLVEDSWKALENDNYSAAIAISFAALESTIRSLVPQDDNRGTFETILKQFSLKEKMPLEHVEKVNLLFAKRNKYIHFELHKSISKKDIEKFINDIADLISAIKLRNWREKKVPEIDIKKLKIPEGDYFPIYGRTGFIIKRSFDLLLSSLLIIMLFPPMLLIAIAIKLSSTGPIFFVQNRIGYKGRLFKMYKFRTMAPDAEKTLTQSESFNEDSGPIFSIMNDPRISRIGRFLRKTSVDEIPFLINVLKGEMSLVGPRPLAVRDYDSLRGDLEIEWIKMRMKVLPGITCLWQVGGRNSLSFNRWLELDYEYIKNWSIWLDIKILFKTIPAVLSGSGAA